MHLAAEGKNRAGLGRNREAAFQLPHHSCSSIPQLPKLSQFAVCAIICGGAARGSYCHRRPRRDPAERRIVFTPQQRWRRHQNTVGLCQVRRRSNSASRLSRSPITCFRSSTCTQSHKPNDHTTFFLEYQSLLQFSNLSVRTR